VVWWAFGLGGLAMLDRGGGVLLVVVVVLGGLWGGVVLAQIKSNPRLATIPVIMLTHRSGDDDLIASYRSGADYYLSKPLVPDELLYGVALVLGRDASRLAPGLGIKPAQSRPSRGRS
jgi:DNA-binding response OmpR family regulator